VLNTASQIIFEALLGDHAQQMISRSVSTCLYEAFILETKVFKIKLAVNSLMTDWKADPKQLLVMSRY